MADAPQETFRRRIVTVRDFAFAGDAPTLVAVGQANLPLTQLAEGRYRIDFPGHAGAAASPAQLYVERAVVRAVGSGNSKDAVPPCLELSEMVMNLGLRAAFSTATRPNFDVLSAAYAAERDEQHTRAAAEPDPFARMRQQQKGLFGKVVERCRGGSAER